jgi:hypothetical protein
MVPPTVSEEFAARESLAVGDYALLVFERGQHIKSGRISR